MSGISSVQLSKPWTTASVLYPYGINYYVLSTLSSKYLINPLPSIFTIEGEFSLGNKVFFPSFSEREEQLKMFTMDLDLHQLQQ